MHFEIEQLTVYDFMNDMFRDLDELKLDYILLDQLYVNFYSELINEKFYVMRHVNRKRSFNVILRGFNAEQLFCFQTSSKIFSQQWLLGNLSANAEKVLIFFLILKKIFQSLF